MNDSLKCVPLAVVREADGTYSVYDSGVQTCKQMTAEAIVKTLATYLDAAYCEVAQPEVPPSTYHTHYYAWSLNQEKWVRFQFKAVQVNTLGYEARKNALFEPGKGFRTTTALRIIEAWNRNGNANGFKYKLNGD